MDWIVAHSVDIWTAFASVVTTASLIAKLTPTEWDDKMIAKVISLLALNKK